MSQGWSPLWNAGWLIASHAVAAMLAVVLGLVQLLGPKGSQAHRALGWLWVALMLWTAGGSLWIHTMRAFGPFSAIHALSLIVLATTPLAALHGRAGRVARHRTGMIMLYLLALLLAGLFTLAPGRVMHRVVFGAG
ncbi:DUF2306 domain-containing protein [Rubrimonas cliftonensis]|nr:DUF2306 domain-containing protein [Rubrimonas cliftonensis]